jgi:hypothetical protein
VIAALLACRPSPGIAVRPAGAAAPLAWTLTVDAAGPLDVTWTDGDDVHHASWTGPLVDQPLLGFRPDRTYTITVGTSSGELTDVLTTPALDPAEDPDVEVVAEDRDAMEPGFTLIPRWGTIDENQGVAVLDPDGQVVWLYRAGQLVVDARTLPDGGLSLLLETEIREIDWLGRTTRWFAPVGEGTDLGDFDHDAIPLDDGGYLALSKRIRPVAAFPQTYDLDVVGPTEIGEDVILRLAADGSVVWRVNLADVLDPTRIGFDSLRLVDGAADWGHANALWLEPDGRVGVSLRNQDAVALLDPADGALSWILGTWANWGPPWSDALLAPVGELEWPSHQHAARRDADGLITLFDNGNARASPGEVAVDEFPPLTERYSRVVRYEVDEVARTVRQVEQRDLAGSVGLAFSEALGDADPLPNGDLLGVWGRIVAEDGALVDPPQARIVEWAPDGREVWHVVVRSPAGWDAYRAERFPGF